MRSDLLLRNFLFYAGALLLFFLSIVNTGFAAETAPPMSARAGFILSNSNMPPPADAAWKIIEMPDYWRIARPDVYGTAWYRFSFHFNKANENNIHAIYISRLSMNGALYLNGVKIGDGGSFTEPIGRNWNRPLLFVIPPHLLRSGSNELYIKLLAPQNSQATLSVPVVDTLQNLQPRYEHAYFVRITLNQTASLLIAAISVLMLSLWWRRKQDTAYALFGLAALVWAVQSINLYITQAPISTTNWEMLINASFQVVATLLFISLLRFVQTDWKLLRYSLWGMLVLAPLSLLLAPTSHFMAVSAFWHLITILALAATLLHLIRAVLVQNNQDAKLLLGALGLILLLAFHDWVLHAQPAWLNRILFLGGEEFLLQFAAPVLFLIIGWVMTTRYVRALNSYEVLNEQLEQRVAAKHLELDKNFAQIQAMLKEQAMLEERERIYQDLHDDVGAKLLTLVYRAQTPNNAELARSALQDLRDVVSCAGVEKIALADAMADFRVECEQRLSDVGIVLVWSDAMSSGSLQLTQPQALNLGRILREAVSNIIRHAHARQVIISLQCATDMLVLEIADDGIGISEKEPRSHGRGLANIRKRAAMLGAEVVFQDNTPQGLKLQLKLPKQALSADA